MAKMTYWEQLKHPRWQRRRLEKMGNSGFQCEECGSVERTLNVHHKQYFKGRMAWDYNDEELACLCEQCHGDAHEVDEDIKQMLTMVPPLEVFALICGYFSAQEIPDEIRSKARNEQPEIYSAGFVARLCGGSGLRQHREIARFAAELTAIKSETRMRYAAETELVFGDGDGKN